MIGADQVNILELDWTSLGGFAAGGAVLSLLTSIASASRTGTPSLLTHPVAGVEPGEHKREG